MKTAVAFLTILAVFMLQLAVFSNLTILHGTADLVLLLITAWALKEKRPVVWAFGVFAGLLMGLVSAAPFFVYLFVYVFIVLFSKILQNRIWQMPILAMFFTTFLGSVLQQVLSLLAIQFTQVSLPFLDSLNLVILPSILLNMLLALPIYLLVSDIVNWMNPEELENE